MTLSKAPRPLSLLVAALRINVLSQSEVRAFTFLLDRLEFIAAFCDCLYAGAVAVPAYLPRPNRSQSRLQAIVGSALP
jgi:acyl-CoA synthetase (AMP-forming)/AMP-acid ligase II